MRDQVAVRSAEAVGHLQRVEYKVVAHVSGDLPPDDLAAVTVEDEREVDEAVPGADVGEVRYPLLVRAGRGEVPLQQIAGELGRGLVLDRRAWPGAAPIPNQALPAHQPRDAVTTDLDVAAFELLPGLPRPVSAPVAGPRRVDLLDELAVGKLAR